MAGSLRTKAIVLRRTNFGETDRILNLLTPEGQKAVRARGVRREKSKLAGGIEMFSVSDVVIHEGKSEMGTLTSAKMLVFYGNILTDLSKLELASRILKEVERASRQVDAPEFFSLTEQALEAMQKNYARELVEMWFALNLRKTVGEEINLVRDKNGEKLRADARYEWDSFAEALAPAENGRLGANHIKLLRLMTVAPLKVVANVQDLEAFMDVLAQAYPSGGAYLTHETFQRD